MKYPDYVARFRPKGTIVKKVNDVFYVYKATSKRVPGKPYPVQVIGDIVGKITPAGLVENVEVKIDLASARILEYAFTDYLLKFEDLYYENNKRLRKDIAKLVFRSYIIYLSPNSYLREEPHLSVSEITAKYNFSVNQQIGSIYKMMECKSMDELEQLKYIFLIKDDKRIIKLNHSDEQIKLLREYSLWSR